MTTPLQMERSVIRLAETASVAEDGQNRIFGFGAPGPALRSLSEVAQLFCVIADPEQLGTVAETADPIRPTFGNRLSIAGWSFAADIGSDDLSSVLILKYRSMPLIDLAGRVAEWTDPTSFSAPVGPVSARLGADLQAIMAGMSEDPPSALSALPGDSNWIGFFLLRPLIVGFPAQLSFLATDPAMATVAGEFVASTHAPFGGESDLCGRIRYRAPASEADDGAGEADHPVRVVALDVTFQNSAVAAYRARVGLDLGGPRPMLIEGQAQWQAAIGSYTFAPVEPGPYALCEAAGEPRALGDWLEPLFARLWAIGDGTASGAALNLKLEVTYQVATGPGLPPAVVPVLFVPTQDMATVTAAEMAEHVSDGLSFWIADTAAGGGDDAAFGFAVVLSPQGDVPGPILDLPAIDLPMSRVLRAAP